MLKAFEWCYPFYHTNSWWLSPQLTRDVNHKFDLKMTHWFSGSWFSVYWGCNNTSIGSLSNNICMYAFSVFIKVFRYYRTRYLYEKTGAVKILKVNAKRLICMELIHSFFNTLNHKHQRYYLFHIKNLNLESSRQENSCEHKPSKTTSSFIFMKFLTVFKPCI